MSIFQRTLGNDVGLDIAIIVLASPHKAACGFEGLGHHIIDQTMLVPNAQLVKLGFVLPVNRRRHHQNNIFKSIHFTKHEILSVETVLSACMHTHALATAHMSIVTIQNLIYTQLKTGSKQRLEMNEDSSTQRKTWQVYSFGKRNVLRFDFWVQRGFLSDQKGKVIPCRWT